MVDSHDSSQAPRPDPGTGEQREWARHPVSPETICRLLLPGDLAFSALRILNVSAAGVTLVLDRIIPVGTTVAVELHRQDSAASCRRPMRVVYLFKSGEYYTLGGAFSRLLDEAELRALT